jgi:CheY-like chemotaxis protein
MKMLVVDDSPASREILKGYLENAGFTVVTAGSGEDAIAVLRDNAGGTPFLMIVDWKMPDLDGIMTIEKIRGEPGIPDPAAIIMVSAYNVDEIRNKSADIGIRGFLPKPVSPSALMDAITGVIGPEKGLRPKEYIDITPGTVPKILPGGACSRGRQPGEPPACGGDAFERRHESRDRRARNRSDRKAQPGRL